MTLSRAVMRSLSNGLPRQFRRPHFARPLSVNASGHNSNDKESSNSSEPADEFERRIFGTFSGSDSKTDAFFQKFDRIDKARYGSKLNGEDNSLRMFDGLEDSLSTLSDGMDGRLKKEAMYFKFDWDEVEQEDYSFRPDMKFLPGMKYDIKDLDLKKPGVRKFTKRREFEVTTAEVLRKADFRNVRFLANFITTAGIIIKRSSVKFEYQLASAPRHRGRLRERSKPLELSASCLSRRWERNPSSMEKRWRILTRITSTRPLRGRVVTWNEWMRIRCHRGFCENYPFDFSISSWHAPLTSLSFCTFQFWARS